MMRILLACSALLLTLSVRAQNNITIQTDSIQWNATSFTDNLSQETYDMPCQFITNGAGKIEWIQKNGTYITSYTVNNTTGTWVDPGTNGSITYSISRNKVSGELAITRTDQNVTIHLYLNSPSGPIDNTYTISTFEKR
jgi:hypothetical protein